MTITELIERLQRILLSAGNVEVLVWREIGAYSIEKVEFNKGVSSVEGMPGGCVVIES